MTEKTERGAWFERLIRGDIQRNSKVSTDGQAERKGTRAWQQQ